MFSRRSGLKSPCSKCGTHDWRIGSMTASNGTLRYPYYCAGCNAVTQLYEKKSVALAAGRLRVIQPRVVEKPQCEVCGAKGAERHHWAPWALFGDEAERWPQSMLCVPCHLRWHQIVTPSLSRLSSDAMDDLPR